MMESVSNLVKESFHGHLALVQRGSASAAFHGCIGGLPGQRMIPFDDRCGSLDVRGEVCCWHFYLFVVAGHS